MLIDPWASLVSSIRRRRAPGARFFKPVCLIAAIDLGNDDLLDPVKLDAEAILSRFKTYVSFIFKARAEMGWKPLWHLSNDGLWTFYSNGAALSSDEFGIDRPPGTKAILFDRFQNLVISPRYRELWEDRAQRLTLRHAMLDILINDDEGCRRFARQLFHPGLAVQPNRWPSEEEVIRELRQSREQLDLFGQSETSESSDSAAFEDGLKLSSANPADFGIPHSTAPIDVPPPTVKEIEAVASPTATLNSASEIDLAANPRVDTSDNAASVEEIPEIQIVQIGVILPSLPGNAPMGMKFALKAYRAELEKRGARPIMGILTNQHSIIYADYGSSDASEWLPSGLKTDDVNGLIARAANRHLGKSDREAAGVLSSAQRHTHFLDSPRMQRVLDDSYFSYADLKRKTMTIFLVLPPDRLSSYSRWLRLLITQSLLDMARTPEKPASPVLYLLDEFAALGHLAPVERAMGLMAGYGVQLWPLLQDIHQLRATYGQRAGTFLSNAGVLQVFGVNDNDSARLISDLLGQETVVFQTMARALDSEKSGISYSEQHTARPLLTPDEVRNLPEQIELLFLAGQRPIMAKKLAYYADPEFTGAFDPA